MRATFRNLLLLVLLLVSTSVAPPLANGQTFLFVDDFSAVRDGERPPVGRWQIIGPTAGRYFVGTGSELQSGNLLNQPPSYALVNTSGSTTWTDVRVGADVSMRETRGSVLLSVRARDGRNQYLAFFTISLTEAGGVERSVEIVRLNNGIPQQLATLPAGRGTLPNFENPNRFFRLEFEARGNNLVAFIEGNEVLRATDSALATGTAGIGASNTVVSFDYVAVTPAGQAAPIRHTAPPAPAGGPVWRVLLRADLTEAQAQQNASGLDDGSVEIVVLPRSGRFAVYMGAFTSEADARAAQQQYLAEGFLPIGVERTGDASPAATPAPPRTGSQQAGFRTLVGLFNTRTQAETRRNEVLGTGLFPVDIVSDGNYHKVFVGQTFSSRDEAERYAQQLLAEGLAQVGVYQVGDSTALDLSYLAAAAGNIQSGLTGSEREQIVDIFAEMERLRRDGTAEDRRRIDEQMRGMGEEQRRFLEGLEQMRGESQVIADTPRATPTLPTRTQQAPSRTTAQEAVQVLRQQAEAAENNGQFEEAVRVWNQIKAADPSGQILTQANDAISRLQRQIDERAAAAAGPVPVAATSGGGISMGLVGGAVAAVVVVIVVVFVVTRRKPTPKPAPATGAAALGSLGAGKMGAGLKPVTPNKAASAKPAPAAAAAKPAAPAAKPAPAAEDKTPEVVGASARIRPGVVSPAPKEEIPASPASGTISLAGLDGGSQDQRPSSSAFVVPPPPDPTAPVHASAVAPITPTPKDATLFYEQTFDTEDVGAMPKNWKGATAYDHASLKIVEREGGSGRCMRFEKSSGTGSAYFSCKFPDATGRFSVEFDLCCIDKNKYLLGFYVEKDEDFRQSVSTVIHRDTSRSDKVTLRVQNEVTDYDLGQWRHVRFVVDLTRQIIDAYIDNEPLSLGIRLAMKPDALNTLSIRDNLATEGILMIDNIRIRKA